MRYSTNFVALAVLCLLGTFAVAQDDAAVIAKARAKAALDLMQRNREREQVAAAMASAKAGLTELAQHRDCMPDYMAAWNRAKSERKPLFLWVGMTCTDAPEIRREFKDAVHCHVSDMNGDATPRLIVGRIGSMHYRFERSTLFNADTPAAIQRALPAPKKTSAVAWPSPDCRT